MTRQRHTGGFRVFFSTRSAPHQTWDVVERYTPDDAASYVRKLIEERQNETPIIKKVKAIRCTTSREAARKSLHQERW